jgi:hypothetical protein
MSTAVKGVRLTTLDYIMSVMDTAESPLDFAIIFYFNQKLDLHRLRRGAQSARRKFPTTGSRLVRNKWVKQWPSSEPPISTANCQQPSTTIEKFVNRRIDLHTDSPVQQLVVSTKEEKTILITRFHHSAADGMSAALWLQHQLEVAHGITEIDQTDGSYRPPPLRFLTSSVRRSKFAYVTTSDTLVTSSTVRSGVRAWETMVIDATQLRGLIRKMGGFTYSDLLATCALEVYAQWNHLHESSKTQKISLWLPINVRQRPAVGFGNGTSRIRIYRTYEEGASLAEKCREIRRQIQWCTQYGEWVVPDIKTLAFLPRSLTRRLLRRNLTRKSLDMATGVFSHADRWNSAGNGVFDSVERIGCVGLLHPFHALAINGATHRGKTWLTFTYDTGLLTQTDAMRLKTLYEQQIELALNQPR